MRTPHRTALSLTSPLALGAALILSACAAKPPQVVAAPPPPPVGHVYPVAVDLPAPVSSHIRFTPTQLEQAQQAFNVVALKSALMVAALTCDQQTNYDTFMGEFQPHVLEAQHAMDAYFRKASGPYSGQKMEDDYVTQLANDQAVAGHAQGGMFCLNNSVEYSTVLAMKTPDDLDSFVTDQPPGGTEVAQATAPAAASSAPVKTSKTVKVKTTKKTVHHTAVASAS